MTYDAIIIGTGVAGSATAFYLSQYKLKILLLEKEPSICMGTTKANSAIMHAGYDPVSGSLKAFHNVQGIELAQNLCPKLNIPYRRNGAFILEEEPSDHIEKLYQQGQKNGVSGLKIIDNTFLKKEIPLLNPAIKRALFAPTSGIIDPFLFNYALFNNAIQNGANALFNQEVINIKKEELFLITTKNAQYQSKIVINAAGVFADEINNMLSKIKYHIKPVKGEYFLLDKYEQSITDYTLFPLPTKLGKGILVFKTIDNNILIGPNATSANDKNDIAVTNKSMQVMFNKARNLIPSLTLKNVISTFAGLRANLIETEDFIIGRTDVAGFYNLLGINSPGLSSALSLGHTLTEMILSDYSFAKNKNFTLYPLPKNSDIKNNKMANQIICKCEMVSLATIKNAIQPPYNAHSLDELKRLTRAGAGRCQSGFCQNDLVSIIAKELKIPLTKVTKSGGASFILKGHKK